MIYRYNGDNNQIYIEVNLFKNKLNLKAGKCLELIVIIKQKNNTIHKLRVFIVTDKFS